MATRKQKAARPKFARQAQAKGNTKVGKAAASRQRRRRSAERDGETAHRQTRPQRPVRAHRQLAG
jgi:hypothetical protein